MDARETNMKEDKEAEETIKQKSKEWKG